MVPGHRRIEVRDGQVEVIDTFDPHGVPFFRAPFLAAVPLQ
jgi:hypothetical protein